MIEPFSSIREIASLPGHEFEKACRAHTSYAYLGDHLALCKVLTKYKIFVDTRDAGVTPHYIMDGFWETWLTKCLSEIVKPGAVCIDIGANFGYYSLLMSELAGKDGKTVAVEPNPRLCELLRLTQSMHGWRFEIVEAALSESEGKIKLSIPDNHFGSATILPNPDPRLNAKTKINVKMTTLDKMVKELGLTKVDVIKMDVEGVEPEVFNGMQETIANNPDLKMIIEYSPAYYKYAEHFSHYLFDNFVVNRIKDVPEVQTLDEEGMKKLLTELTASKDHTDLYLIRNK
jgi:FkbM family methyltransferase